MKTIIENTENTFVGQEFILGLDVHKKDFRITIRNNGRELKSFTMDPKPQDLSKYMKNNYPGGRYKSVYEAGFCGYWIDRELRNSGIENIIINPADIPSKQKERKNKNDKIDSRKLARELENNSLEGIYIPSKEEEAFRNISRLRIQITKEQTRIKERIKSFLDLHGIELPPNSEERHWSKRFISRIKTLKFDEEYNRYYLDKLLEELSHQRSRRLEILRLIRKISKDIEEIQYLRTVPGVGMIIAFTLYAELYKMERFRRLDQLASIVGLIPSISGSSDKIYKNELTERGHKYLRPLLIEAAWKAVSIDPALTAAFNKYSKRMSKQRAIIRIAKKLLSRIRCVWKNNQPYVIGVVE